MDFSRKLRNEVRISSTDNGYFMVNVGCVILAFQTATAVSSFITEYLENPTAVEQRRRTQLDDSFSAGLLPEAEEPELTTKPNKPY